MALEAAWYEFGLSERVFPDSKKLFYREIRANLCISKNVISCMWLIRFINNLNQVLLGNTFVRLHINDLPARVFPFTPEVQ